MFYVKIKNKNKTNQVKGQKHLRVEELISVSLVNN